MRVVSFGLGTMTCYCASRTRKCGALESWRVTAWHRVRGAMRMRRKRTSLQTVLSPCCWMSHRCCDPGPAGLRCRVWDSLAEQWMPHFGSSPNLKAYSWCTACFPLRTCSSDRCRGHCICSTSSLGCYFKSWYASISTCSPCMHACAVIGRREIGCRSMPA